MPPDHFVVDAVAAEEARAMKITRGSSSMLHDILCIVAAEEDDQGLLGFVGSHVETSEQVSIVWNDVDARTWIHHRRVGNIRESQNSL